MKDKTILILEDEKPLLAAIKKKLESEGFETVTARSVQQAWDYLNEVNHIDVIWLDHYLLGQEDGLDLVTKLKAEDSQWQSVPVFVVSNTASSDKVRAYIKLGIHKYYTKADYRLDQIISDIKEALK